jgi:uncharacterized protein
MNIRRLAWVLAFTLAPLAVQAQSFDCRTARHADEYAICDNGELAELDIQMSNLYFRVLNSLGGLVRAQLHADQVEWLSERRECGSNVRCIRDKYIRRIRELERY